MPELTLYLLIEGALAFLTGGVAALIFLCKKSPEATGSRWLQGWIALLFCVSMLLVDHLYPSPRSPAGLLALASAAYYVHVLLMTTDRYLQIPRSSSDRRAWNVLCIGMVLATALMHIPSAIPPIVRNLPIVVLILIVHIAPAVQLRTCVRNRDRPESLPAERILFLLILLWGVRLSAAFLLPVWQATAGGEMQASLRQAAAAASLAGSGILLLYGISLFAFFSQVNMEKSRRIHRRYDAMFENNSAALLLVQCDNGQVIDANPAAVCLYGYGLDEFTCMTFDQLYVTPDESAAVEMLHNIGDGAAQQEAYHRLADGTRRYVRISSSRILEDGRHYVLCTVTDLTFLRGEALQAAFLTMHDQLTGLYSRNWIRRQIADAEARQPVSDSDVTVLYIDVNNLHMINEQRGISIGDQVLIEVAGQLRKIMPSNASIVRSGGDEFLILLRNVRSEQAYALLRRLGQGLQHAPRLGFPVRLSCGMATAAECGGHLQATCTLAENRLLEDKLNRADSLLSAPIQTLLALLRERYIETEEHALRLKDLSLAMARAIGLPAGQYANLELLANLHDIGKIAISEAILLKEGALDAAEWSTMRQHPDIGARIVNLIPHANSICEDIRSHHERWDGSGYPRGLSGEDIPLLARIVALADAWDAMTHDRPYKPAMKWAEAIREIDAGRGWQFDPNLTDEFLRMVGG